MPILKVLEIISEEIVEKTLDRLILIKTVLIRWIEKFFTIKDRYNGGPVGIETLSATIGEDRNTIEEVYEPFLTSQRLYTKRSKG